MMPEVSGYDVLRDMALSGTAKGLPSSCSRTSPKRGNETERRLLEHGVVLDVLAKTKVHEHPHCSRTISITRAASTQDALRPAAARGRALPARVTEGDAARGSRSRRRALLRNLHAGAATR
jgi:hypothetical protein